MSQCVSDPAGHEWTIRRCWLPSDYRILPDRKLGTRTKLTDDVEQDLFDIVMTLLAAPAIYLSRMAWWLACAAFGILGVPVMLTLALAARLVWLTPWTIRARRTGVGLKSPSEPAASCARAGSDVSLPATSPPASRPSPTRTL